MKIAIIGVGRLGGALALALSKKGYEIIQLIVRQRHKIGRLAESISPKPEILSLSELSKISSDVIFITTPDTEIQTVAETLAANLKHTPVVFHTSGSRSSEILESLREINCQTASLHPLVSISEPQLGAERFKGSFFCIEGDEEAVKLAKKFVSELEGKSFSIPTKFKTLYHASAVMTSGHTVALFSIAIEALSACGLSGQQAQEILFPLLKSTVENLSSQTPARSLTGTFSRADVETLKLHLKTLSENASPETLDVYRQLGMRSVTLAQQQGADEKRLEEMKEILTAHSNKNV